MKVDAVILAGGDGEIIDPAVHIKGLVPVAGRPLVEWVVDAMRAAENIAEVAVVVPTAENLGSWADKVDKLVVSDGSFIDNVIAGVDSFRNDRSVLVATGDLPALTGAGLDDYVAQSIDSGADLTYPLVPREAIERDFPGSKRTYIKLATGEITGGNMMLLAPEIVKDNRELGQRLFDTRKSPVKMARLIGIGFIVKLVLGKLDPQDVERKVSQLIGGTCAAIITDHAAIGADVDKPADVIVAERVLYMRDNG